MADRTRRISWFYWVVAGAFLLVLVGGAWFAFSLFKGAVSFEEAPQFVGSVAAIGVLTMALVQVVKMTPVRGWFQEERVRGWIKRSLEPHEAWVESKRRWLKSDSPDDAASVALRELAHLAVTNDRTNLFDLPIEQLCAQMLAGAESLFDSPVTGADLKSAEEGLKLALESPSLSRELSGLGAAAGEGEERSKRIKDAEAAVMAAVTRQVAIRGLAGAAGATIAADYLDLPGPLPDRQSSGESRPDERYLTLRSRLAHQFQRNLDGLQIEIGIAWRRRLWIYAMLISTLLAGAASANIAIPYAFPEAGIQKRVFFTVVGGVVGGFMATVARDVVAVIERWRR
jgi:hypothetical protein